MAGGKLISTGVEFPDATTQTTSGLPLTGGTMTGALTTTGFTSTGIDDNATSTAITIDASENVGIGTATPAAGAKAHIYSSTANVDALFVEKTSDEANSALRVKHVSASDSRYIARFENGTNDIMRIGAAGTVTLGIGNLVIGTSGKGIDFSAATPDGTGSTGSEVLDDYEQGTFTCTLTGTTEPGTLITTTGYYTKIGNTVSFKIQFAAVNTTGYAGDIAVTGLPFTSTADRGVVSVASYIMATFTGYLGTEFATSSTIILIKDIKSAATWSAAQHSAGTGRYLVVSGTYLAA